MAASLFFSVVEVKYMRLVTYFLRLWFTIRALRAKQVFYRIYYNFFALKIISEGGESVSFPWVWKGPEVLLPSVSLGNSHAKFLNIESDISKIDIWNDKAFEKLWLYNLHYFDHLNAIGNTEREVENLALINRWISENPLVIGNGWEPYPLSLRITNLVKWYSRSDVKEHIVLKSLMHQAEAHSKQIEYHILGNHLFANAKALIFVGCFLKGSEGTRYLLLGLSIIDQEIENQFLQDGGHFELSPMYHCIVLWDLLDLINLALVVNHPLLTSRISNWRSVAKNALYWLKAMIHPDGEVSFFNDSAIGVAAKPLYIFDYAESLSISSSQISKSLTLLEYSGYSRIQFPWYTMLIDHAEIGASYLPGHGHADTLSFELSVGLQRVIVNSGTSVYGISEERLRQRRTAAHNTLEIDCTSSSDVWSGFRVGRRAKVRLLDASSNGDQATVSAEHNGYSRIFRKISHHRTVRGTSDSISILDEVNGITNSVVSSLHLHPDVKLNIISNFHFMLEIDEFQIDIRSDVEIEILESTWHPRFGVSLENKKLV